MLPVYQAISFQRIMEKGGRTNPWLILADNGIEVKPFVMKLFSTEQIQTKDSVCGEVIGNVLARQLDLPVPEAALIKTSPSFRMTINDQAAIQAYDQKDNRIKFGSEYLDGYHLMNPRAFNATQARRMIEIGGLFAFDNLIRNPDRNHHKPNLLVKRSQAALIDHEVGFEINPNTINEFRNFQWEEKFYRYHIFYNYLKNSRKDRKSEYFNEFGEYLRLLNINNLNPYFSQLTHYGYSNVKHQLITDYLTEMKGGYTNFVKILKGIIG